MPKRRRHEFAIQKGRKTSGAREAENVSGTDDVETDRCSQVNSIWMELFVFRLFSVGLEQLLVARFIIDPFPFFS